MRSCWKLLKTTKKLKQSHRVKKKSLSDDVGVMLSWLVPMLGFIGFAEFLSLFFQLGFISVVNFPMQNVITVGRITEVSLKAMSFNNITCNQELLLSY